MCLLTCNIICLKFDFFIAFFKNEAIMSLDLSKYVRIKKLWNKNNVYFWKKQWRSLFGGNIGGHGNNDVTGGINNKNVDENFVSTSIEKNILRGFDTLYLEHYSFPGPSSLTLFF